MTSQEYLQLVQNSQIFKSIPYELQEKILSAPEKLIPQYLEILKTGDAALDEGKMQFLINQKNIIKTYGNEVKKIKIAKLKRDEEKIIKQDGHDEEQLLAELNQL